MAKISHVLQAWGDPEDRGSIAIKRRNMRVSLKQYLHKTPTIGGVPTNLADYVPTATQLADAYRLLVKADQAHHGGDEQATTWSGLVLGHLFAAMWNTGFSVQVRALPIPASVLAFRGENRDEDEKRVAWISEFANSLPAYEAADWLAEETVATANLLADAYVKAFAELKTISESSRQEIVVLKHHAAVLAETISDMTTLAMEEREPNDLRLPDGHAHKSAVLTQRAG